MSDLRGDIAIALQGWLTPEQLKALLDEILSMKKSARGWCGHCKKHVVVEIPDAKAVVGALSDLTNQGFGRPSEASGGDEDRIVFKRLTKLEDDADDLR